MESTQPAGLGRRLGAMVYDGLLIFALLFLGTVPFVAIWDGEPVTPGTLAYQLTLLAILYAFFVGFWSGYGRTLGMQSWRLRIETPDGRKPSIAASSLRFFAAILSWLPLGLGFWWQLRDRDRLTWHDRLSHTRLVHYPPPPSFISPGSGQTPSPAPARSKATTSRPPGSD